MNPFPGWFQLGLVLGASALWPAVWPFGGGAEIKAWPKEFAPGFTYTNLRVPEQPWSIHVVRVDRAVPDWEVRSTHAAGGVGRVSTLSAQVARLRSATVQPVAGINGDFYARDRSAYTGDPRGLQIVDGELLSAPVGGAAFWVDGQGGFQIGVVTSLLHVSWPDGTATPVGLNQARRDGPVLYTPAMGPSTYTVGGRELVLEREGTGPWLPLAVGEKLTARVRAVREVGSTPLSRDIMVLSLDPYSARTLPRVGPGAVLRISTATTPNLRGAAQALSGGPILLKDGRPEPLRIPSGASALAYEFRSMRERHPRSALGWNSRAFFLIQVDGRQSHLSVGMTLEELADFALRRLGCTHALNLDGGVSSTLWANGRVRNSPCGGEEKDIACGLVVVRRLDSPQAPVGGAAGPPGPPNPP